ncbi:MAG: DNA-binding protein [Chlorobi bacterium]|nr:DNA-binding protein [Chlorobiota bacterium]
MENDPEILTNFTPMFAKRSHKKQYRKAEDLLKYLYFRETDHTGFGMESAPAGLLKDKERLLAILRREGWVEPGSERLTEAGRRRARDLIRRHRLFEVYLSEQTGHHPVWWHRLAEGREHYLTDDDIRRLEEYLGFPLLDPHGDPIPTAEGEWVARRSMALDKAAPGQVVRILHIEDEPESLLRRILAYGFYPGGLIKIIDRTPRELFVAFEGERLMVPVEVARHVAVEPVDETTWNDRVFRLTYLTKGREACIVRLADDLRGLPRQRLLDLGFVPGTRVWVYLVSPLGEPVAYHVRGSHIALRREQSDKILVELCRD